MMTECAAAIGNVGPSVWPLWRQWPVWRENGK